MFGARVSWNQWTTILRIMIICHSIPKQKSRFSTWMGMVNYLFPKFFSIYCFIYFFIPHKIEFWIIFNCLHKLICKEYGYIWIFDHIDITSFNFNEFFNIWVVNSQCLHICSTSTMLCYCICIFTEQVHESRRTAGFPACAVYGFSSGS